MKNLYAIKRMELKKDGTVTELWWTNGAVNAWSENTPKYYNTVNKAKAAIQNSYWLLDYESDLIIVKFEIKEIGVEEV